MKFRPHPGETTLIEVRPAVAIVGGGIAGVTAAHVLAERGYPVTVFDKARGLGGRMSTRREGDCAFDHGCQFFTARDDRFRSYLETWLEQGWASVWRHRIATCDRGQISLLDDDTVRYIGVPGMNAMIKGMADGLDLRLTTRVTGLTWQKDGWHVSGETGPLPDTFELAIVAVPSEQAVPLLAESPRLQAQAASVRMQPCWSVMALFDVELDAPFDAAFVRNSPLVWVANGGSKPGRAAHESWVLHASPAWSRDHLEADPDWVKTQLLEAFYEALGIQPAVPTLVFSHRWRFAAPENALDVGYLWDPERGIGAAGDWCLNARVENAFLSGLLLADRIIADRPRAVL